MLGGRISPPKVPLAPGKYFFVFSAGGRNLSKCQRPKMGQKQLNCCFWLVGVRPKLFLLLSWTKLRKTIPDSMLTLFPHFGTPFALGPAWSLCPASATNGRLSRPLPVAVGIHREGEPNPIFGKKVSGG